MTLALLDEAHASGARWARACEVIGVSLRTVERWRSRPHGEDRRLGPHHAPPNALTPAEQTQVLAVLEHPAHRHLSPKQLVPRLADAGIYLASESTMYRLARRAGLRARRRSIARTHVTRAAAVHRATAPNQVWSWDITYLPTVVRGRFLYLYLVLDVWSRRIVGWQVHENESADLAARLIRRICDDEKIDSQGLVLHSDNGAPMRGSTMLSTLQRLGVVPSFSRPHVSNDNPTQKPSFERSNRARRFRRCRLPTWTLPVGGWRGLSAGTTASTATVRFATSPLTSATSAGSRRSSTSATNSTNALVATGPIAGPAPPETGSLSLRSSSIQKGSLN